jgi:hypothetical protein
MNRPWDFQQHILPADSLDEVARRYRPSESTPRMSIETARLINAAIVSAVVSREIGDATSRLPEVPLADMLEAGRMVRAEPPELVPGGRVLHVTVDDGLLALHYAYEHFDCNVRAMLAAGGFSV